MVNIINPIGVFKALIDNRLMRTQLKNLSTYCEKDGSTRLEIALEIFVGLRDEHEVCWRCRWTSKIVNWLIGLGAKSFGTTRDEVREAMKDVYWRRGLASVVKGLAMFGVRKPFVPGAPFLVVWDVTYACNLKCKHCYANAGKPLPDELTTEEAKRVIECFAKAGVVAIAWSGGEPMVRPDIYELSRYAYERGMYVAMATNGTLINEHTADKLWESGVRFLQISLDAATPEKHDEFRGVPGAWERTIEGIKVAVKKGFFVNVAMTGVKTNKDEIPQVIELCRKLGVRWFMLYNFVPTGRGVFIDEYDLSPTEREEILKMLWRENKKGGLGVLTTAPQYSRIAIMEEAGLTEQDKFIFPTHFQNAELGGKLKSLADFIGGCGAGRFYFGLWPNGDIRPCVFFPMKIGNILEVLDNFDEWWANNKILQDLRDKDKLYEPCGSCPYRYVCGGCRARAYGYLGDYMGSDPGCIVCIDVYNKLKNGEIEVKPQLYDPTQKV